MSTPIINRRYRLLRKLGSGGAGISYLAEDTTLGGQVVIKRFRHELAPSARNQVPREVALLKQLCHPNIPKFIDFFELEVELERLPHLVQTYVPGEDLRQELARRRHTVDDVLVILEQVLEILVYLQALSPPVIHRDIKPENIIRRSTDGALVLIDFGIAIGDPIQTFGHTMATGTLGYQALEQIHGNPGLATDVYGLGVVALEFLSRRHPGELISGMGALDWRRALPHAPPAVCALLERMLAVSLSDRFPDARAAREGVRAARRAPAPPARSTPAPAPPPPKSPLLDGEDDFFDVDSDAQNLWMEGPDLVQPSPELPVSTAPREPPKALVPGGSTPKQEVHWRGLGQSNLLDGLRWCATAVGVAGIVQVIYLSLKAGTWSMAIPLSAVMGPLFLPQIVWLLIARNSLRLKDGEIELRHGLLPFWRGYRRETIPAGSFDRAIVKKDESIFDDEPTTWQVYLMRGEVELFAVTQELGSSEDAERVAACLNSL